MADSQSWNTIKTAFDEGRLGNALTGTLDMLHQSPQDPALYYNAGNLNYRLGDHGLAVAYFEKALHLAPHSAPAALGFKMARDAFFSTMGTRDLDPGANWYQSLDQTIPLVCIGAAWSVLFLAASLWALRSLSKAALPYFPLTLSAAAFLGAVAFGGLSVWTSTQGSVVCIEKTSVRSGPGEPFLQLSTVDPGIRLRLLSAPASSEWLQVRFASDSVGWVKASALLPL